MAWDYKERKLQGWINSTKVIWHRKTRKSRSERSLGIGARRHLPQGSFSMGGWSLRRIACPRLPDLPINRPQSIPLRPSRDYGPRLHFYSCGCDDAGAAGRQGRPRRRQDAVASEARPATAALSDPVQGGVLFGVRAASAALEHRIPGLIETGSIAGATGHLLDGVTWRLFWMGQIWIFVLFVVYTTAAEIIALFGLTSGQLFRAFFHQRPSNMAMRG